MKALYAANAIGQLFLLNQFLSDGSDGSYLRWCVLTLRVRRQPICVYLQGLRYGGRCYSRRRLARERHFSTRNHVSCRDFSIKRFKAINKYYYCSGAIL